MKEICLNVEAALSFPQYLLLLLQYFLLQHFFGHLKKFINRSLFFDRSAVFGVTRSFTSFVRKKKVY